MLWNLQSNASDVLALGPRTAGQLARVGISTVAELLAAKPQSVVWRLAMDIDVFGAWQREAQLILALPQLPAVAARMLAEVGLSSVVEINRYAPTQLLAELETAQQKKLGGWLAQTTLPTVVEISNWIRAAQPDEKFYAA